MQNKFNIKENAKSKKVSSHYCIEITDIIMYEVSKTLDKILSDIHLVENYEYQLGWNLKELLIKDNKTN